MFCVSLKIIILFSYTVKIEYIVYTIKFLFHIIFVDTFSADLFGGSPLIDTSPPWDHVDHPQITPSEFFGQENTPFPTNVWWQNMVLNDGDQVAAVLPYLIKAKNTGLHVCLPGKVKEHTIHIQPHSDMQLLYQSPFLIHKPM